MPLVSIASCARLDVGTIARRRGALVGLKEAKPVDGENDDVAAATFHAARPGGIAG
jgi:hypothetical protein